MVAASPERPLEAVAIFLVHHMTADVLGLIASLRKLGCRDLVTLFIAYAGEAPGAYLGPLLDLPADEFTAVALTNIPDRESTEGQYRLSTQYSVLDGMELISTCLRRGRPRFFEAMRSTAKLLFMRQVERAHARGRRCVVIEDGGYLAPAINRACLG